ncbi:hypothetical protein A5658_13260 [Mycobacterium sp. 1245111.1]|uniref:hypothetical protein n=1 Tax=Mycobacterium sp. 1245111.1 TaxID=1834073 RepID=UPI0007FD95E3|nr:hypothetical protein [Mycobacterium sp. 1245111.1]OBK33595.1 hypothetical protein A5658_13260 [Mycobacterium sp. 1245111.1]
MQPQYPYYPGYPPPIPPRRHSVVDITLTVILGALAGFGALASVSFSFFFVMATDSCGSRACNYDALGQAYVVTWGGIGVAILVGAVGIIVAAVRHRLMWVWPAVSLVLIAVSTGIGVSLANSVMHQN